VTTKVADLLGIAKLSFRDCKHNVWKYVRRVEVLMNGYREILSTGEGTIDRIIEDASGMSKAIRVITTRT
jgi:hypothetical protein